MNVDQQLVHSSFLKNRNMHLINNKQFPDTLGLKPDPSMRKQLDPAFVLHNVDAIDGPGNFCQRVCAHVF